MPGPHGLAVVAAVLIVAGPESAAAEDLFPSLFEFRNPGSDRFIVDFDDVRDGHPFIGLGVDSSIKSPHQGIHVYFKNEDYEAVGNISNPEMYPPVYAFADMVITSVDFTYVSSVNGLRHIKVNSQFATSGTWWRWRA